MRLFASTLVAVAMAVPAFAQEAAPPTENVDTVAVATPAVPDGSTEQVSKPGSLQIPSTSPVQSSNPFKVVGGDFKNFFSGDTGRTLAYTSIIAIASAPWDREGVDNGFNIPTTVFQSGNVIGQFAFQLGAGAATYTVGKFSHNQKTAAVGFDLIRAQLLSQGIVQTLKYTVRRDRPDGSNDKSFPSGHSASMFASATVLNRHYGWKVGVPAYALGSYVALARMAWNRHHASDVVMGAGFGIASARTVTMSMAKSKFSVGVQPQVGGASVNFTKIYNK